MTVDLYETAGYAFVQLDGIALGGHLEGRAVFATDGESVVMDAGMERALRRRRCSVERVKASKDWSTVSVDVKLPLFGIRSVSLYRVSTARGEARACGAS